MKHRTFRAPSDGTQPQRRPRNGRPGQDTSHEVYAALMVRTQEVHVWILQKTEFEEQEGVVRERV
jgi:hypothetical protein